MNHQVGRAGPVTNVLSRTVCAKPPMPTTLACLLLLAAAGAGGCVTEIVPVPPTAGTAQTNTGVPVSPNGQATSAIPGGSTSMSRVAAAILPLGAVPYDGLTLPLITPNGRWLITQTGSIPPWESVLAEPGAVPVPASAIKVFAINDGKLKAVDWPPVQSAGTFDAPPPVTSGLLLGRCAGVDATVGWVLVERPNADGSRWIGRTPS